MRPVLAARLKALQHSGMRMEKVRPLWEPEQYSEHQVSPARFETFKLLYKEGFKHLCTLKEWCVIGVVITAVVKDFGHIGHKLCQLVVMSLLQTGFHCRKVCKGEKYVNMSSLHCNINIITMSVIKTKIYSYPLVLWLHDSNQVRHGDPLVQGKAMPFCETEITEIRFNV